MNRIKDKELRIKNWHRFVLLLITIGIITVMWFYLSTHVYQTAPIFAVRSIDTAKYSRDLAAEKINDPSFKQVINQQVAEIAQSGANYVAIDTPYDEQFLPYLKIWVQAARDNNLHIWFRGNFSGWEGWFNYQKIDRPTHQKQMNEFISKNPDLFEDGDIFTPCPECENGGPGDPRQTGDVDGFRKFMISEYADAENDFGNMGKKIITNYNSMNLDVAKLVMDKSTTSQMGGVVTVDHYVSDPKHLVQNIDELASSSGGQIVIGEFGTPIPDINGQMNEGQQADWIDRALSGLTKDKNVIAVNYWTGVGGTTALWDDSGNPRQAVDVIQKYYNLKKKIKSTF